ncbi:MAG: TetR/AcrR family transcriptional regulator [Cyclobacteriaceae bacterium]
MARPKKFDHDEVMEKAMLLFWKKGFHGTSVQDLVDHLGINRSTMYASFGDKDKLFLDSLKYYRKQQKETMHEQMRGGRPFCEFLESFLDGAIEESLKDPEKKGCFIVNASVDVASDDPQTCSEIQQNLTEFTGSFKFLMDEAKENGEISQDADTTQLAHFLYNTISGIKVISRIQPDTDVLKNVKQVALKAILK